jgi:glycosyltransferase involved in cell wall biosynthesis
LKTQGHDLSIIVVDDRSTDETAFEIFRS